MELTREQIIERGDAARTALENPVLSALANAISQEAIQMWAETAPHESKKRDECWAKVHALRDIWSIMVQWHQLGQQAKDERTETNTDE